MEPNIDCYCLYYDMTYKAVWYETKPVIEGLMYVNSDFSHIKAVLWNPSHTIVQAMTISNVFIVYHIQIRFWIGLDKDVHFNSRLLQPVTLCVYGFKRECNVS